MACAAHGMKGHVEQLVAIGADPTVKGPGGLTAVDLALKGGHNDIAGLLLAQRYAVYHCQH